MALRKSWREKFSAIFGIFSDGRANALDVLSTHYVEESQHSRRIAHHAERMQYPQFRDKLSAIATDESKHAQWMADKIRFLGGTVPQVPELVLAEKNSWEYLLADLEEQQRCAGELLNHIHMLRADFPEIADTLQRVYDEGIRHRGELRSMLMRSDPQAHLAA